MSLNLLRIRILQVGKKERQWVKDIVGFEKRIVEVIDHGIQAE